MPFKALAGSLAMFLGFLGVAACFLGIYAVWLAGSRLDQANDRAFATVDRTLAATRDRVLRGQQRVQESRLSTDEIGKHVRDWAAKQAAERVVSRLEIESKAGKLLQKFQQVDMWLDTADESIRGTQQILEMANLLGASVDTAWVEEVLGKLTLLRNTLQQAEAAAEGIRESVAKLDDTPSREERATRALRLIARTLVAITELDTRLGELANRLTELQACAGELKARTSKFIAIITGAGFLLFAWMGAGQVTLCLCGWKTCRRRQEEATDSGGPPSVLPAGNP